MKYLVCLVALLLLCLSPNPSFGQPNSSEVEDLYWKVLSAEEWPYEDYEKILGTLDEFYGKNKDRISQKKAFFSKVEDYINKLIKKKPQIVQELIGKIDELNKEIKQKEQLQELRIRKLQLLRELQIQQKQKQKLQIQQKQKIQNQNLRKNPLPLLLKIPLLDILLRLEQQQIKLLEQLQQKQQIKLLRLDKQIRLREQKQQQKQVGRLLNALAAIIPDSSLEKYAYRGLLKPDQVEYIEYIRNHLAGYGFQFPTAKSESQGKSRSFWKSRKSRSTSERNEFEALAVTRGADASNVASAPPSYDEAATRGPNGNPDSKIC